MSEQDNKKEESCISILGKILLFFVILPTLIQPYFIVIVGVTSELIDSGMIWYDAVLHGIYWPIYLVDFIVQVILSA